MDLYGGRCKIQIKQMAQILGKLYRSNTSRYPIMVTTIFTKEIPLSIIQR